ncbi:unnamed protein product, partial [Polarella glacialis]
VSSYTRCVAACLGVAVATSRRRRIARSAGAVEPDDSQEFEDYDDEEEESIPRGEYDEDLGMAEEMDPEERDPEAADAQPAATSQFPNKESSMAVNSRLHHLVLRNESRMCAQFCFKIDLGSEQNILQSPQEAWSVALPGAREILMLFAALELYFCTVAALCCQDTEVRLATEPPHGQQFWTRPPPLQPGLFTSTLRASAMVELSATSRAFTFKPEDMKDANALEIDGSELHQDMCTICLADFKVSESATRLPCRHIFHSACIECWTLSMQGPFIGCPLRCETGRTSMFGQEAPNHLIEDSGVPRG